MKNAVSIAASLWSCASALIVAHGDQQAANGAVDAVKCTVSHAQHENDLMKTYCGDMVVKGIDKSINARGCKAIYTDQVQLALANHMFKKCDSMCLFDFDLPHLAAFRWKPAENCWLKADSCGEPGEQDTVVALRRTMCQVPQGPCQPVVPQLSDKVMSHYCAPNELKGSEKFATASGCEEVYTHQVRRSLANRMFEDCSSHCLFDFDQPKSVWYAWITDRRCWMKTGSPCGPPYAQHGAMLRKEKFCKDHTLRVNEEGCVPFVSQLSNALMADDCGDLSRYSVGIGENARACLFTDTPMVKKALANHMFSQCGSQCIYDYDNPHVRWYSWNAKSNCYDRNTGGCQNEGKLWAMERKALACEFTTTTSTTTSTTVTTTSTTSTETSTTTATSTSTTITTTSTTTSSVPCRPVQDGLNDLKSFCPGESPHARGCDFSDTPKVRKAFANFMFAYCGATCLFDFDNTSISFNWDPFNHCWQRHLGGGPCGPAAERQLVRKRRTLFC